MRRTNPFSPYRLVRTAALLFACAAATAYAQDDCDCSCEAYHEFFDIAKGVAEAADSGEAPRVPAELMAMSQCTGTCAMAWSGCREPVESRTPDDTPPEKVHDNALLTADYLEGTWCSNHDGQKITQWQFDERGHYRLGVDADDGWEIQPTRYNRDDFMGRFRQLVVFEADRFTLRDVNQGARRDTVFTRGDCS